MSSDQPAPGVEPTDRHEFVIETERLIGTRLKFAGLVWVIFVGLAHLYDARVNPGRAPGLLASLLIGIASWLVFVGLPPLRRRPSLAALGLTAAFQLNLGILNWLVGGEAHLLTLGLVCQLALVPLVLLWDERLQIASSVTALAAYLIGLAGDPSTASQVFDLLALGAASAGSVVGARVLTQIRARLFFQARALAEERDRARAASRALEVANQAKTDFLNTVSHEMRTPVHVLLGYLDILLEECLQGDTLAPNAGDLIRRMRRRALELSELVDGTLDLSRLESGQMRVARDRFAVLPLIEEVRDAATDLVWGGAVELSTEIQPEVGQIESDRARVRDILRNLVINAVKFTRTGTVTIGASLEGHDLVLLVRDTGVGIPAEQLASIFDAFHQVGPPVSRGVPGVGLGLHLVERFVHLLGGSVEVRSTPGVGSQFTVRLPGAHFDGHGEGRAAGESWGDRPAR